MASLSLHSLLFQSYKPSAFLWECIAMCRRALLIVINVAFFEYHDQKLATYAKPAGVPYEAASQFDHLSLHLPDEEALLRLRDRLKSHGCEVTDVVDHGFLRSIYFSDPTGIALEATWWTLDPTGRAADYGDDRLFADADPVPAVRELRETGELDHTVETKLVDSIILGVYGSIS